MQLLSRRKCMSDVVRDDCSINFHLSKLSNTKFSILYDISLVRDWKSYLLHVLIVLRLLAPSAFTWQEKHGCVCTYLTTDRLWSSGLWICQLRLLSTEWCQHGVDIPRTWPSNNGKSWPIWSQVRLHREKVYILLMMNSNVSLVRMEIPVCKNWDRSAVADRWTDGRTDRQTDSQLRFVD